MLLLFLIKVELWIRLEIGQKNYYFNRYKFSVPHSRGNFKIKNNHMVTINTHLAVLCLKHHNNKDINCIADSLFYLSLRHCLDRNIYIGSKKMEKVYRIVFMPLISKTLTICGGKVILE